MQLGMLESRSLAGQVADNLEQLIIDNKLSPGDKIPNELDLVSQLGVGRGTIREAMKILESRSVVEIRRGKGTYVCSHVGMVEDPLGFRFAQDKKKLARESHWAHPIYPFLPAPSVPWDKDSGQNQWWSQSPGQTSSIEAPDSLPYS